MGKCGLHSIIHNLKIDGQETIHKKSMVQRVVKNDLWKPILKILESTCRNTKDLRLGKTSEEIDEKTLEGISTQNGPAKKNIKIIVKIIK